VSFPLVLYRTLLGLQPTLADLKKADPIMGRRCERLQSLQLVMA
jgi:hypothetical protein